LQRLRYHILVYFTSVCFVVTSFGIINDEDLRVSIQYVETAEEGTSQDDDHFKDAPVLREHRH
jgi:hypothetical protein